MSSLPGLSAEIPSGPVIVDSRGPSPVTNHRSAPSACGDQKDIGEQDRRVEAVAADRLQRDLGGKLGIVAQRQEIPACARVARYSGR
jgi:hypothetical protein